LAKIAVNAFPAGFSNDVSTASKSGIAAHFA
jgi:hypothetical protein